MESATCNAHTYIFMSHCFPKFFLGILRLHRSVASTHLDRGILENDSTANECVSRRFPGDCIGPTGMDGVHNRGNRLAGAG